MGKACAGQFQRSERLPVERVDEFFQEFASPGRFSQTLLGKVPLLAGFEAVALHITCSVRQPHVLCGTFVDPM